MKGIGMQDLTNGLTYEERKRERDEKHYICETINGERRPLHEWAKMHDIPYETLYRRYTRGKRGLDLISTQRLNTGKYKALDKEDRFTMRIPKDKLDVIGKWANDFEMETGDFILQAVESVIKRLEKKSS
jgi:hypothetical protein